MADRVGQIAPPYTAQQCPICRGWFYVMDGPFAEGGGRTKPYSDFLHMEDAHPEHLMDTDVLGIPYCSWNDEPVTITVAVPKE